MTTKQIKGKFTDGGNGRCALGAALSAINGPIHNMSAFPEMERLVKGKENFIAVINAFPLLETTVTHPMDGFPVRLDYVIWTLNDGYGWSREAIADFVESIENK